MSKFIPAALCAYIHAGDVDSEKHINARPINDAMDVAVARADAALENPTGNYTDFQRAHIATVLKSMQSSHGSIRKILGWGQEDPRSVDALAVARVPLEGLYTICLFTESPDWVDVYLRDGWKKQYELFLLQVRETQNLKRFDEYSKKTGPYNLAMVGKDPRHHEGTGRDHRTRRARHAPGRRHHEAGCPAVPDSRRGHHRAERRDG